MMPQKSAKEFVIARSPQATVAISSFNRKSRDCFASLAMTILADFWGITALPLISILFISVTVLHADFSRDDAGTTSAQFLKLGAGARAEALAGAYGAVCEDSTALYWNPAGLTHLERQSATVMHAVYVESIFYDFASYALPIGKKAGLGAAIQYLSVGEIEETDDTGLKTGTFRPENWALSFGGGYRWQNFAFGAALKYVRARIRDTASAATAEVGLLYSYNRFSFGGSIQNIFSQIAFDHKANDLPLNIKVSGSYKATKKLLLSGDLNLPRDHQPEISFGLERSFELGGAWALAPRVGYSSRPHQISGVQGITAGFGIGSKALSIDYAWVPLGELGQTHKISLTVSK